MLRGGQEKRIHYLCEDEIEKSVTRDHCLSSLVMHIGDPWDRFFYLTLMLDSYSVMFYYNVLQIEGKLE